MRNLFWTCLLIGWLGSSLAACGLARPQEGEAPPGRTGFMDLWQLYSHCHTSTDAAAALIDAERLRRLALMRPETLPGLLRPLERLIERQPSRLAADPVAMAADCSLHAADLAASAGMHEAAMALYRSVVSQYRHHSYVYYRDRAAARLETLVAEASADGHADGRITAQDGPEDVP